MELDMAGMAGRTALVIGATGGIGGEVAKALGKAGWQVRALHRAPEQARAAAGARLGKIEWIGGDAMRRDDVVAAAAGASLVLNAANPPFYRDWRGLALPMLANAVAAAQASGARLVLPGNIYNYGPDAGAVLREDSPQHPLTRKGAVRVEMEGMLQRASRAGLRALVVRAGDFFGPIAPSSWFNTAMVRPGQKVRYVLYPGPRAVGHAFAFLPDLAAAIVRLAAIEERLAAFETVHFAGHWLARGDEMAKAIRRAAAAPRAPIVTLPAALLYLGAPFSTMLRETIEMRYLWQVPLRLDNAKLVSLIGAEPHTPLDQAVRATLAAMGCLPATMEPDKAAAVSAG
jgi:nucleoside-diphosphate-sugar epimerase